MTRDMARIKCGVTQGQEINDMVKNKHLKLNPCKISNNEHKKTFFSQKWPKMLNICKTRTLINKQLKMDPRKINIKNVKDYQITVEDCQKQLKTVLNTIRNW